MLVPAAASTSGQPHCGGREGRRGGGCLTERCGERPRVTLTWRQPREYSHPGPGPPTPTPARTLDFCSSRSPRPSFRLPTPSLASSPPPPGAPRIPGSPAAPRPPARQAEFPLPRMLTPSPPPQPDPRALPRILGPHGPFPAPTPNPGGPGAGEGAQSRARPLPLAPHCSPAAVPGPPGQPPGNPGAPNSRLWGLGKAGRQNPAPGDLTP